MSIKIKNLQHTYNSDTPFERNALVDINLDIKDDEFIGIIGSTGSGKSTLIQHLNGLLKPTNKDASIEVYGHDLLSSKMALKEVRRLVGIVFQYPEHQLFEFSVYEDVAFGPKNIGMTGDALDKSVRDALSLLNVPEELFQKSPFELSGGQKRKVAIAGVIAMNPKVLILDEPTAGLDPKSRDELFTLIKNMKDSLDMTIIFVSHSMEDISVLADRILVLDKGRIVQFDTPSHIFKDATTLTNIGLDVPEVTKLFTTLKDNGFDVDLEKFSVEDAICEIYENLR